jgi:hypothetical protein
MKNPSKMLLLRRVLPLLLLITVILSTQAQSNRYGKDRALLFAVNDYTQMTDLKNPIPNARDIAKELEQRYGFTTEVVTNPTFEGIERKILEYKEAYKSSRFNRGGQLLIFFSGHGMTGGNNGYFMPADADPDRPYTKGIEYDFWRSVINDIDCRHILVAIDACHSITFDPNWDSRNDRNFNRPGARGQDQILMNHGSYKARLFMTSDAQGDKTPDRSTFARKMLEGLRTSNLNKGYMTASELFANYLKKASPTPGGGDFGDDQPGSCFLFFPKQNEVNLSENYGARQEDINAYKSIKANGTIAACQQYLKKYPNGEFRNEVSQILNSLVEEQDWEYAQLKNTTQAYRDYVDKYPYGRHINQARQSISTLNKSTTVPNSNSRTQPTANRKRVTKITGKITDDKGEPLIGANILIVGTTRGTASDIDGDYALNINEGDQELVVSFVGYDSKRVNIGYESEVNVSLVEGKPKKRGLRKLLGN